MVHTVPTRDDQDDNPYLCDCGATFSTATELNQHNLKKHGQGVEPAKKLEGWKRAH